MASTTFKKILITPYFGRLPEWIQEYQPPKGYEWLLDTDIESFKRRVKDVLGFDSDIAEGTGKVWDFRCALGLLYEKEIAGFDFWGHTDFDCVYGNVGKWVTDEFLNGLDVHSNHHSYVNGCWSLYRNTPEVNNLFKDYPSWQEKMMGPPNGWVEQGFSRVLEKSKLRYKYTFWQGDPYIEPNLKKENGKLYQDGKEIMMFHFRQTKRWPL